VEKVKGSELKEGIELLKTDLLRSRRWSLALGWLSLVYGLITLIQVALTALMMTGVFDSLDGAYLSMLAGFGSSFISVICALIIIPLGIVLIRAGYDVIGFITDTDFTSLLAYQRRIRTASILAAVLLILLLLSSVVMGLTYALALSMPGF